MRIEKTKKPVKALLVTPEFPPIIGGISTYLYNLFIHLLKTDVSILTPSYKNYNDLDKKLPFKIYRKGRAGKRNLFFRRFQDLVFFLYTVRLIRKEGVAILCFGYVLPTAIIGLILEKIMRKPYIVFVFATDVLLPQQNKIYNLVLKNVLGNAKKIISISNFTKNVLKKFVPGSNITVVYPGVDTQIFKPLVPKQELIGGYSLRNKKIILTVGRIVERKGMDTVIRALPMVISKIPNVVYIILGEGPYKANLFSLMESLNLKNHVIFLGEIPYTQTADYYNLCDAFVMVSREAAKGKDVEGLGLVYLEANACGKPTVGGNCGGIPEAIINNVTGLLVDPNNIEEVGQAIINLLGDREYAKRLGENGLKRIEQHFHWHKSAEKLELIFEEIVNPR